MVKGSISHNMTAETVESVSMASSKTVELLGGRIALAYEHITIIVHSVRKIAAQHSGITTVGVGLSLLCFGMFGLWFTILTTTGI